MIYESKKFRTLGAGECMRSLIKIFELKKIKMSSMYGTNRP